MGVCVSYFTAFILKIKCNLILSGEKKKSEKKYVRMLERNKLYIFPLLRSVFCVSIYICVCVCVCVCVVFVSCTNENMFLLLVSGIQS